MTMRLNRRDWLRSAGMLAVLARVRTGGAQTSAVSSVASGPSGLRLWHDGRFHTMPRRPWRKIHLDFHNSEHVPRIGADFDEDAWGEQLVAANVDSIVVFAKDMHGYCYWPSETGPVHPGLKFDLLGAQVRACRKRGIAVYAYYCTGWDHHLAKTRPAWRMIKRDGTDYMPKRGETPGWTALCFANAEFREWMDRHIREFVGRYELDGVWFDVAAPIAPECFCAECQRQIREGGGDPNNAVAQREHKHRLFLDWHRHARDLVRSIRPGCQVDFNDIGLACVAARAELLDNIDIEALPTGGWGYFYAPMQIRYQRNFGVPVYGMTGRFVTSWADFGGLKTVPQLDVELASIVANAARCDVGDQMSPNGRLDPAVYHVIGRSFGRIRKLEPWLEGAAPVTEAAMMIPAIPFDRLRDDYLYGVTKLLLESRRQFDVVEPVQEWERYGLVVLPDAFRPDAALVERLRRYVEGGGALVVCGEAGVLAGGQESWLAPLGLRFEGASEFKPSYMVPRVAFAGDLPVYEYALYEGAGRWRVEAPAESLADLGVPLFQRSAAKYTSHRQTPFERVTEFSVAAVSGRVGLIGFPIGAAYYRTGYWIYRALFEHVLGRVRPERLLQTDAPLATEFTVTRQAPADGRDERWMVHIVNWSPDRKAPPHPEFHDSPSPLRDVRVRVALPLERVRAHLVVADRPLEARRERGAWEVVVPRVDIHEIVAFEPA
ncbi:MAG: alpha-L-fucosidase [Kiritimatiellae bacterium]|nr:alpha-L-fucosidase [Kiritimatiellia bacterium]